MQYFDSDTTKYKVRIIEKARRAKKEVGKRSKSKQPDKIETENGKPGTRKVSFRVILIVVSVHDITLPALALKWDKVKIHDKKTLKRIVSCSFLWGVSCKISVSRVFLDP